MSERHVRWILAAVLFLQLLVLTAQAADSGGEPSRLEAFALGAVAPFARLVDHGADLVDALSIRWRVRSSLLEENRHLRRELARLENERIRWFDATERMERLSEAVEYRQAGAPPLVVADVVYVDHVSWLRSLVLWAGADVGVDQAVVAPEGVVGRVISVSGPYAKVQLLTDRSATIGAMLQRTRRQGVVRGAERGMLKLDFIPLRSDVRVGDLVVTAGIDGIYPRSIPVGRITRVEESDELFYDIEVAPAVDFGRLDRAYVLAAERLPDELEEARIDATP